MVFISIQRKKLTKTFGGLKKLSYLCNVKLNRNISMKKTIKDIEVIAYKGMNSDMTCRGFQYEIGKTYKTDRVELCECGFHAYLNPQDVLDYYEQDEGTRYFKVKLSGEITKCKDFDTKVAATEITILEEITDSFNEVIENTEWWKNNNVLDLLYYSEGFAVIQRGGNLYNFIDKQGNILSNEWFDYVWHFQDEFAVVQRSDGLWNFIDKQGNYLSEEWFYHVSNFCEGFAAVERSGYLWNFIDKNRNYLFDEWFNDIFPFYEGLAAVQRSDKLWNYIDKNRNYLSDEWFNYLGNFKEGFAVVERSDGLYNFIDKQGNILSNEWFYNVYSFKDGFASVYRTNGEFCKIHKTGKIHKL